MALANVHIVDAHTGNILFQQVLVGYDRRRLFVPENIAEPLEGCVVHVEFSYEPLTSPVEVHSDFQAMVDTLGDELESTVLEEEELEKISRMTFCMLTKGIGIQITSPRPNITTHGDAELSIFYTKEGFLPHRLIAPPGIDVVNLLGKMLSSELDGVDAFFDDVKVVVEEERKMTNVYLLKLVRVIPMQ